MPSEAGPLPDSGNPATVAAREAIVGCIRAACGASLADAVTIQAKHSAGFMTTPWCRKGRVGAEYARTKVD